jgi:hypothetical protein
MIQNIALIESEFFWSETETVRNTITQMEDNDYILREKRVKPNKWRMRWT